MKKLAQALLIIPGIIWGASFIAVEFALVDVQPITLTLMRSLISTVMLLIMCYFLKSQLPRTFQEWWPFFFLALCNQAVPFVLLSWAQIYIEAGLASIYMAVMPLFTVLLAAGVTSDEELTFWKLAGVGCGLLGIIVLIGTEVFNGIGINVVAQLALVTASLLYAIGAVLTRFVYPLQPEGMTGWPLRLRMVTAQFIMSILILIPGSLWLEEPFAMRPSLATWGWLIFLGIGVTALATITYFFLIEELGAGAASMTIYLIPIAGVIAGVLILEETFRPEMGFALFLILGGIAVTNLGDRFKPNPAEQIATQ